MYKSGPEAKFPSTLNGGGRERAEMLSEEKEAAMLVQTQPAERGGLSKTVRVCPATLPGTSPSRASARPGRGHVPPRVTEGRTGPPLSPPDLTGGNEGQPCPAPQFRIQLRPDTEALGTKTLALGFMLYEQR